MCCGILTAILIWAGILPELLVLTPLCLYELNSVYFAMGRGNSYSDVVDAIYELEKFSGKITLDPITDAMEELGNPQDTYPAVHVAGTNGKGSTTTLLARILEEAGYTVGTYTSPHLTDFRERIAVDGEEISHETVVEQYEALQETDADLSFFEFTTALAFLHFAEEDVDIAVFEAGLGGRMDATNIIDPEASVITNVAQDHTKWLGETPEQIAYEKAGIIKSGKPVISGASGEPQTVIETVAEKQGASVVEIEDHVEEQDTEHHNLVVDWHGRDIDTLLMGRYQVDNINTALTACKQLEDFAITDDAVIEALQNVVIPGRMEKMSDNPLLLLEGAHNAAGMETAAETFEEVSEGRTITVTSIMADKNYEAMMETVESFSDLVFVSEADIDRAAAPETLADCIESTDYEIERNIRRTVTKTLQMADAEDTIIFTGSLYFIGDVTQVIDDMWYEG